ncbi:hypothetical protein COO60DRAFT_1647137 [Scenedesmus sp. NREL 46B-D3]|nr:hypothetical protein COO60DRAFT_1647137 [Scenedesmus sp. NREL 46B-D3]
MSKQFINHQPAADSAHHDDLLFFIKSPGHPTSNKPPFFVRRKAKQLPEELQLSGAHFSQVDWAQTVLLNIVLQSQYQLTVVACGREALPFVAEGRTWSAHMITVSKPVYASTTVTAVNLDSSRAEASNPQPCYPDICFAVDNFDNAFEDLVLEDADKCYCVVLHAVLDSYEQAADRYPDLEGMHTPSSKQASSANEDITNERHEQAQKQQDGAAGGQAAALAAAASAAADSAAASAAAAVASAGNIAAQHSRQPGTAAAAAAAVNSRDNSGGGASASSPLSWQIGTQRRTLFAGYVSYAQILEFMDSSARSRTLLDALMGSKAGQQDKVVMTGPGGVGRCEVAVKKVQDSKEQASRSSSSSAAGGSNHGGSAAAAAAAAEANSSHSHSSSSGGMNKQAVGSSGGGSSREQQASAATHPQVQQQKQQQQQRGLLQRGLQRARVLASGVQQALSDLNSSGGSCNMNCAMMLLKLPVSYLARELLDAA